jgi:hypothetical protein
VTGGKPIAVRSQSFSDVSAVNVLVAFYDIHGIKGEVSYSFALSRTLHETGIPTKNDLASPYGTHGKTGRFTSKVNIETGYDVRFTRALKLSYQILQQNFLLGYKLCCAI